MNAALLLKELESHEKPSILNAPLQYAAKACALDSGVGCANYATMLQEQHYQTEQARLQGDKAILQAFVKSCELGFVKSCAIGRLYIMTSKQRLEREQLLRTQLATMQKQSSSNAPTASSQVLESTSLEKPTTIDVVSLEIRLLRASADIEDNDAKRDLGYRMLQKGYAGYDTASMLAILEASALDSTHYSRKFLTQVRMRLLDMGVVDSRLSADIAAYEKALHDRFRHFLSGGDVELGKDVEKMCAIGLEGFCHTIGYSALVGYKKSRKSRDLQRAIKYLQRSCDNGYRDSCYHLATALSYKEAKTPKSIAQVVIAELQALHKACLSRYYDEDASGLQMLDMEQNVCKLFADKLQDLGAGQQSRIYYLKGCDEGDYVACKDLSHSLESRFTESLQKGLEFLQGEAIIAQSL